MMLHDDLAHELLNLQFGILKVESCLDGDTFHILNSKVDYIRRKVRNLSHGLILSEGEVNTDEPFSLFIRDVLLDFTYFYGDINFELTCYPKKINYTFENNRLKEVKVVISELIQNSIVHSSTDWVRIGVTEFDDQLSIIIEDSGSGFDLNSLDVQSGIGLKNCKERILNIGGALKVDSTLYKGTTVIIEIPK